MGCFHSKDPVSDTGPYVSAQQAKKSNRSKTVAKFVPGTYDYDGLTAAEVNQLLESDRSVADLSIRNLSTWAKAVYVYDGDTCHINILYKGEETKLKCRVYGIDTPEIRTSDPLEKAHAISVFRHSYSSFTAMHFEFPLLLLQFDSYTVILGRSSFPIVVFFRLFCSSVPFVCSVRRFRSFFPFVLFVRLFRS